MPKHWSYKDFPHKRWEDCEVYVNDIPKAHVKVEYGKAVTEQQMVSILFEDGSRLNIWLDPDYAVWKDYAGLDLSTCPKWTKKCGQCAIHSIFWRMKDELEIYVTFCQTVNHKTFDKAVNMHIFIRNKGYKQKRFD